jgi:hypothetical protein
MFLSGLMGLNATQSKLLTGICASLGSWVWMHLNLNCSQACVSLWVDWVWIQLNLNCSQAYVPLWVHVFECNSRCNICQCSSMSSREQKPCNHLILNLGNPHDSTCLATFWYSIQGMLPINWINLHVCDSIIVLRWQMYLMRWQKKPNTCHLSINLEFENLYNADGFDLIWTLTKCSDKE